MQAWLEAHLENLSCVAFHTHLVLKQAQDLAKEIRKMPPPIVKLDPEPDWAE